MINKQIDGGHKQIFMRFKYVILFLPTYIFCWVLLVKSLVTMMRSENNVPRAMAAHKKILIIF